MINLTRRYMILMSVLLHSWHYYPRHMFDETKKKEAAVITVFCSKLEHLKRQSRLFSIFSALEPQFHHSWNICIEDYAIGQCIIQGYSCVYRYRPVLSDWVMLLLIQEWTFFQNVGINMVQSDPFMSHLATQLGYSAGSFRLYNWLSL